MEDFKDYIVTVKPVLMATSIKQATCFKQARIQFPKKANTLKCTCIKGQDPHIRGFCIITSLIGYHS